MMHPDFTVSLLCPHSTHVTPHTTCVHANADEISMR